MWALANAAPEPPGAANDEGTFKMVNAFGKVVNRSFFGVFYKWLRVLGLLDLRER